MNVLVLGHKGMLGHMVVKYLTHNGIRVITTDVRWPESPFKVGLRLDYVINCIGAIPQRTTDFDVNWQLPIWLDLHAPCRVIHPGTDCEMDNDAYGISKRIASDYICSTGTQTKTLKTSIVGPELHTKASLMEWFLSRTGDIDGYSEHFCNANTTLEWSKQCLELMTDWDSYEVCTVLGSNCISKFELLTIIKQVFNKDIHINPTTENKANKCLIPDIKTADIKSQLIELKQWNTF